MLESDDYDEYTPTDARICPEGDGEFKSDRLRWLFGWGGDWCARCKEHWDDHFWED